MKLARLVAVGLLTLSFAGAALAAPQADKQDKKVKNAAKKEVVTPDNTPVAAASAEYVIGPEDVLNINVWKEAELSGAVPVRPDGKISLPLLNDVQAAGSTPMALTTQLTEKLKKFLEDPRVTVTVSAINSQRVYLVGQVARPGAFPLTPQMTVLQALSSAGGLAEFANGSKVYILRNENGSQVKLPFDYKAVLNGQKGDQNILLKSGDTIVVP